MRTLPEIDQSRQGWQLGVLISMVALWLCCGCHSGNGPAPAGRQAGLSAAAHSTQLQSAKDLFYTAVAGNHDDIEPALQLLDGLGGRQSSSAEVVAYLGAVELLKANVSPWIWEKASLAHDGLALEDRAVNQAPDNLEVRFLRGVTNYQLPHFLGRMSTAESDIADVSRVAEQAAREGRLDRRAAAAALDVQGKILEQRYEIAPAIEAWRAAIRIDPAGSGGRDALRHLAEHHAGV